MRILEEARNTDLADDGQVRLNNTDLASDELSSFTGGGEEPGYLEWPNG